jgi:hypothetical protein
MDQIHLQFSHIYQVYQRSRRLTKREVILHTLKENLVMAQNHTKQQADQDHYECQFVEGDQVFHWLQPYKKNSLKVDHCRKLAPKFYGPYIVLKHVG